MGASSSNPQKDQTIVATVVMHHRLLLWATGLPHALGYWTPAETTQGKLAKKAAWGGASAAQALATSEGAVQGTAPLTSLWLSRSAGMQHQWCRHAAMRSQPHALINDSMLNKGSDHGHTSSQTYSSQMQINHHMIEPHDRTHVKMPLVKTSSALCT